MKKLTINSEKGLTLVEMLITVAIIGIAIITLYLVFIYGIKINQQAKHLALAYQIANQEMETIRNTLFTDLVNQTEGNFYSDSSVDLAKLDNGQGTLTIRNYQEDEDIKEIIINVTWNERGMIKTVTLTTLATSGGISQ